CVKTARGDGARPSRYPLAAGGVTRNPRPGWPLPAPPPRGSHDPPSTLPREMLMKAVVLHEADDMRVEARPVPEPAAGEVLLKVNVTSICGTDVKVLHRTLMGQPPGEFIMGHEYAGTVAALGPDVDEFRVGDRVAVEVHKGCERCENCVKGWYTSCLNYGNLAKGHRAKGLTCDGGFAEYAVNHVNTLYKLPDNLTFEQACMVTTAASPLWAIDLMGGYLAGET